MAHILFWKSKSKELLLLSFWLGPHAASSPGRKWEAEGFVQKRTHAEGEETAESDELAP